MPSQNLSPFSLILIGILIIAIGCLLILFNQIFAGRGKKTWKNILKQQLQLLPKDKMSKSQILIELDKLLEYGLQNTFFVRNSLGSILKQNGHQIYTKTELNQVWFAHKVRNKIAHEVAFLPDDSDLDRSIKILEKAIKKLISFQ